MKYLDSTADMPLVLSADDSGQIRWWIDASFAVHSDMKSHTGATLSMGKGAIYSTSGKQKHVTRSSTEAEIVAVHDVMPQIIWTGYFLDAQGFNIKNTIMYQDNTSSILIEKNGRQSSSKHTRHMNIRYFFIKDQVESKHIRIEHCPTAEMIADFFTKPLQGATFRKLRDHVMNLHPTSKYHSNQLGDRSVLRNNPTPSSDPVPNPNRDVKTTCVTNNDTSPPKTYKEALVAIRPPTE